MTTAPTSAPRSFESGLPRELWGLTASYAFLDVVSAEEGNLEKVPGFLRVGCEAMLQRPVLELRGQDLTSSQLRVFSACMPHLREVDLRGSEVDGKHTCELKLRIKCWFERQPDLKIVILSGEEMYRQHLPRVIERDIQAKKIEKIQLEAKRERLVEAKNEATARIATYRPSAVEQLRDRFLQTSPIDLQRKCSVELEEINQKLTKIEALIREMEQFLEEVTNWQSSSPSFQEFVQNVRTADFFLQYITEKQLPAWITLVASSSSQDEKKEAYAYLQRVIEEMRSMAQAFQSTMEKRRAGKDENNKESWIFWYAKVCEDENFSTRKKGFLTRLYASMFQGRSPVDGMQNYTEQTLAAAVKDGKISEEQRVALQGQIEQINTPGGAHLLQQFLAEHKPQE